MIRQKQEESEALARDYFIHPRFAARPVGLFEPKPAPVSLVQRVRLAILRARGWGITA